MMIGLGLGWALVGASLITLGFNLNKRQTDEQEETLELDDNAMKLNELMQVAKIHNSRDEYPTINRITQTERCHIYWVDIPLAVKLEPILKLQEVAQTALKKRVKVIKYQYDVGFKVYDHELPVNLIDVYPKPPATNKVLIPVGYGWDEVLWWDVGRDYPHAYVGGATGSGKSSFTHTAITYITEHYPDIKLILCDLKGSELSMYQNMSNVERYINTIEDVPALAQSIQEEVKRRYEQMGTIRDLDKYNKEHPDQALTRWIVMFDEVYDFMLLDKETKILFGTILSKSRACGIHFAFSTQRAVDKVLPNDLTTHLSLRVGFKMNSTQESVNLVESSVLYDISKDAKGRGYTNAVGELQEFQGYFTTEEKCERIAKKHTKVETVMNETRKKGWFK